jgi:hypothetical protein
MPAKIHGRLGASALAATTDTTVYTVPASRKATATINLCNRGGTDATVRLMVLDGAMGTLANEDYIEYDVTLPAGGTLERDRITLAAGHVVGARASTANVSVQVWGVEEDA